MLSNPVQTYLRSSTRTLIIIWIAFQAAAAIYYLVARLIEQNWDPLDRAEVGFTPLFYVAAALLAVISIIYQRRAFSDAKLAKSTSYEPNDGSLSSVAMARNETYQTMDEPDRDLVKAFAYLQVSYIITWTFQEAIALLGLIMAIVTRDISNVVIFNVAAIALLFTTRPAPRPLMERIQRLTQLGAGRS